MVYIGWDNREYEDPEMDAMREDAAAQPGPALLIYSCDELAQHGSDCYNVETPGGEVVSAHVTYTAAYKQIYGVEPPDFDPFLGVD